MLLCALEAMDGGLCLLEVMRCVLLCMLEVPEVMRCVLLCMLEVLEVLEVPEVMRCVLLWTLEAVDGGLCFTGCAGGDALCAALYARGCGGCDLFAEGVGGA